MHDDPDEPEGVDQVVRRTSAMYAGWARSTAQSGNAATGHVKKTQKPTHQRSVRMPTQASRVQVLRSRTNVCKKKGGAQRCTRPAS